MNTNAGDATMTTKLTFLKRALAAVAVCAGLAAVPASASASGTYRTCARSVNGYPELIQTVPGLECYQALTIAKRGSQVDGDDGNRFFYMSVYWQCVTIARPDYGQDTEMGCFENHAGAGSPFVKITIYTQAD